MKELIIVGTGESWRQYSNPNNIEVWGVNGTLRFHEEGLIKIDKLFFFDKPEEIVHSDTYERLNKSNLQLITTKKYAELPNSEVYPYEEVLHYFGDEAFGNSVCYMFALAIMQGYDKWYLYGVDMKRPTLPEIGEHKGVILEAAAWSELVDDEKPYVTYWYGQARARGVEIINTDYSDLCKPVKYGTAW